MELELVIFIMTTLQHPNEWKEKSLVYPPHNKELNFQKKKKKKKKNQRTKAIRSKYKVSKFTSNT
jgi:hypothetical protein